MRPMHGRFVLALSVLLLAAVPGSSAADWKSYQVVTAGFAIAMPGAWVDVTSAAPEMLKAIAKDPSLEATAKLASETDAIRLLIADPVSKGRAYMDAGVQRVGDVKLATLATATADELRKVAGVDKKEVKLTSLSLPAGSASLIIFATSAKTGAAETAEYMLVKGQIEYVFAYSAPRATWAKYAAIFATSAKTFRFLKGPDLTHTVLSGAQVGAGYKLQTFPGGDSVIGESTLDLCAGNYPSEALRVGRLQVRYTHPGHFVYVSNEVVTYVPGGAQQALSEVTKEAKACTKKPVVIHSGGTTTTFRLTPLADPGLPANAVAVRIVATSTAGKKRVVRRGVAIYQVKGNTLSGVYAFSQTGTTPADAARVGLHAAVESARNLGGLALTA